MFLRLLAVIGPVAGLQLYHRTNDSPFVSRGSIDPETLQFLPADSLTSDLAQFSQLAPDSIYQVALAREPGQPQSEWAISHVKTCHLRSAISEHLILHGEHGSPVPFAFDYFLSPIQNDGSCPSQPVASPSTLNTTVTFRPSRLPPLPELQKPPPLTPEGKVVEPVPEQTFFQKYWMYIAGFLLVFLLTSSGPEEEQKK